MKYGTWDQPRTRRNINAIHAKATNRQRVSVHATALDARKSACSNAWVIGWRVQGQADAGLHLTEFMTEQLLAPLRPNESALTPLFQANIDEGMLREIAEADYGWKADEYYALLQPIVKAGLVPSDDYNLREVLELISLAEPDDPKWKPGGRGQRGHWMRLFACTVLVRLGTRYPAYFSRERNTLLQLISSAIELGPPVALAAACVCSPGAS